MFSYCPGLSVGIVVFCKNEAAIIGTLVDRLLQNIDRNDIFVVDGHSTDGTTAIVRQKNVQYLLDNGRGKGSAIRQALGAIKRDVLVFMDSDGSHQPEEIPLLLKPFSIDDDPGGIPMLTL
ncbi:MAG: glycosyltransferase family 2 protein [Candidatus Omnitrophica bacterium]|nr:glycosyltransferase family 2 protein [Candidatus Omnitrophota bacterium]